jgi:hypothetical protein
MLDNCSEGYLAEHLPPEVKLVDETIQRGRHEVLI